MTIKDLQQHKSFFSERVKKARLLMSVQKMEISTYYGGDINGDITHFSLKCLKHFDRKESSKQDLVKGRATYKNTNSREAHTGLPL